MSSSILGTLSKWGGHDERFRGFTCCSISVFPTKKCLLSGVVGFAPPFDFINYIFLTLFGLTMLIIDLPVSNPKLDTARAWVSVYALFMTRFVGRGFW